MLRYILFALLLLLGAAVVYTLTTDKLLLFNRLVPKDAGSRLAARDLGYGPLPRQKLDIYMPRGRRADGPLPVIVFIHGGGWRDGEKAGYEFAGRAIAAQGFAAVVINYRLVPDVHYPAFVEDGAAAVRWVRGHIGEYGGDGERIVIAGHSAGAYIAAMLAMDQRWLGADRAAVKGWAGLAGPYAFLPLKPGVTTAAFGRADDLPSTQPINFAGPGDPAALIAIGEDDDTITPGKNIALADRLRAAGVPVELRLYPGIGHLRIVTALSRWTRGSAPSLADLSAFARAVTAR